MLSRFMRRFLSDRRGNILPMFGLTLIPLVGLIGAAVDYSRANAIKAAIQAALDSTALAMASKASTLNSTDLTTAAQAYFDALFVKYGTTKVPLTVNYTTTGGPQITVSGQTTVDMMFMRIPGFGINTLTVGGTSTTAWGNTRLRVALVLDNTGSMSDDGKIDALKTATTSLLSQLKGAASNNGDVYVSIIPFSKDVNVGSSNYNASWIDWTSYDSGSNYNGGTWGWNWGGGSSHSNWNGCITDRGGSNSPSSQNYDQNVTAPISGTTASLYPAEQYSYCPVQMVGLTYDWTKLNSVVSSMTPNGSTNQPIGLVWGWLSLVGGGPLTAPAMDSNYTYKQVIILLSDGLNTEDRWYGNGMNQSNQVDSRMYNSSTGAGTCANIKGAGITIYTIQVNTGGDPTSTLLQNCASSTDKFFMLTASNQIVSVFNQIGTQLSKLRVAK